jgi:hypothetical protein
MGARRPSWKHGGLCGSVATFGGITVVEGRHVTAALFGSPAAFLKARRPLWKRGLQWYLQLYADVEKPLLFPLTNQRILGTTSQETIIGFSPEQEHRVGWKHELCRRYWAGDAKLAGLERLKVMRSWEMLSAGAAKCGANWWCLVWETRLCRAGHMWRFWLSYVIARVCDCDGFAVWSPHGC